MARRLLRVALLIGTGVKHVDFWKPKLEGVRSFSSNAKKFIEPGFDFGHPPFGAHWGVPDVPIGDDGLPLYVDWTLVPGAVGSAQDEEIMRLSYVYAPLASIASVNFLRTGESVILSAQHVIDCNTLTGVDIDLGGVSTEVLDFVIKNGGILPESLYPFTGVKGVCKMVKGPGVSIDDWMFIKPKCEYALKYSVAHQPVIVDIRLEDLIVVDNKKIAIYAYKEGTITGPSYYKANHSVLLVGYDDLGRPEWKCVNSNGTGWGQNGMFWVARGTGQPGGALGILRKPFVPLKWNSNGIVTSKCDSCTKCFKKASASSRID